MKPLFSKLAGLIALLFATSTALFSQATTLHVFQEWAKNDGLSEHVYKATSAYDNTGCLYVVGAGMSINGDYNWLITKYNTSGVKIWSVSYDAGSNDQNDLLTDIVIDANCNLYVVGTISSDSVNLGYDLGIGCFDSSGAYQWSNYYDNGQTGPLFNDAASSIAMDNGYIYVTGVSQDNSTVEDIVTLQYDMSTGTQQWVQLFDDNNYRDLAVNVSVFTDHSILVSGATERNPNEWGVGSLEYEFDGTLLNNNFGSYAAFDSITEVYDVAIANNGDIYMTGSKRHTGPNDNDIKLLKFDSLLNFQWAYNWYNGGKDAGTSVKVDEDSGYVYVGGYKYINGTDLQDYVIYKVDTSGSIDWEENYNMGMGDFGRALALDNNGNPIITGYSWSVAANNFDYYTLKADQSDGSEIWNIAYNGLANKDDQPSEIALDYQGNIFVIGQSEDTSGVTSEYITVKYVEHELYNIPDTETVASNFNCIENKGQLLNGDNSVNESIRYYSHSYNTSLFLGEDTISFVKYAVRADTIDNNDTCHRVSLAFFDANTQIPFGWAKKNYHTNYYFEQTIGTNGLHFVPSYERFTYPEVFSKIDVEISANTAGYKIFFVMKPGGSSSGIKLNLEGEDTVYIGGSDELIISTVLGNISFLQARSYQIDSSGNRVNLTWQPHYVISGDTISFDSVGIYNSNLPLVLEMYQGAETFLTGTAEWSTFFGGGNDEMAFDITNDQQGNIYVTGETGSNLNFPTFLASQSAFGGGSLDMFISRFNEDYSQKWSTFYGSTDHDHGYGIAHDETINRVYICGWTNSSTPSSNAVFTQQYGTGYVQTILANIRHAVLGRFNDADGVRDWGTCFGGPMKYFRKIDVDNNGNVYVVGTDASGSGGALSCSGFTSGDGTPICNPAGAYVTTTHQGGNISYDLAANDGFIARFNSNTNLTWSTFFGGPEADHFYDVAFDDISQKLWVVGTTRSLGGSNLPLYDFGGFFTDQLNGTNGISQSYDGLLLRFSANGSRELATFFGGFGDDIITSVSIPEDIAIGAYISGVTSTDTYHSTECVAPTDNGFPHCSSAGSYDQSYGGGSFDAFIAYFAENDLVWSTFVGGDGSEGTEIRQLPTDLESQVPGGPVVHIANNNKVYLYANTRSESVSGSSVSVPLQNNGSYYNESSHQDSDPSITNTDVFVNQFYNEDLEWGTYYGGTGTFSPSSTRYGDWVGGITTFNEKVFICGGTYSTSNFPLNCPGTVSPYCQGYGTVSSSYSDAYISQLNLYPEIGIEENSQIKDNIMGYPNPTASIITLKITNWKDEMMSFEVLDLLGKTMLNGEFFVNSGENIYSINLQTLVSGLYVIRLKGENKTQQLKVIKE